MSTSQQLTGPLPAGRTPQELAAARRQAVEAWERAERALEATTRIAPETPALRVELERRREARRREHEALLARSAPATSAASLPDTSPDADRVAIRAVLAHRDAGLREQLAQQLAEVGVVVVGSYDDGADASGAAVAEQPELMLIEDRLPSMDGLQVLRRVRTLVPGIVTAAHVGDLTAVGCFTDGGVDVILAARTPPADMAQQLLGCLCRARRPLPAAPAA